LVKKKIKRKRVRKKAKKEEIDLVYVLLSVALVIMLMWGIALFLLQQTGIIPRTQVKEPFTQETFTVFPCRSHSECFLVGCKSNTVTECVNTLQMEIYYKKCKAWWDVRVEIQDFSNCACINGFCKAQ